MTLSERVQNKRWRKGKEICGKWETDLGKRSVLVAFWDKHGLLRSPGLFQSLVPLNTALGLTCICNILTLHTNLRFQCHVLPKNSTWCHQFKFTVRQQQTADISGKFPAVFSTLLATFLPWCHPDWILKPFSLQMHEAQKCQRLLTQLFEKSLNIPSHFTISSARDRHLCDIFSCSSKVFLPECHQQLLFLFHPQLCWSSVCVTHWHQGANQCEHSPPCLAKVLPG